MLLTLKKIRKSFDNFFLSGHERTLLAKKNIVISLILKGFSILITLVLVPITINYVNPNQYGIWLTLSSVINLFSFFDIGLGNGLKNKLAEANAKGEALHSKMYISTTYAIISIISIIIFAIFFVLNFFLDWNKILNVNTANGLGILAMIVFGSFCVQLILQLLYSVLSAFHQVSKISLISFVGQLISLICIYCLSKFTQGSLVYLVITLTCIPLITQVVATFWFFLGEFKSVAPTFGTVNFKFAKNLLSIGGLFFFIQLGSLLLFQTDNIIITQLFGPSEVTVFNLAYKLFSIIVMVFSIIMTPFWPAFTDAYAKNDIIWIKNIFKKIYKYWFILIIISICLLFSSPFIFKLWIGDRVKISFMLSLTMTLYVIGTCWMMIHNFFINGVGKLRVQFYLYLFSTIINIPLSIFLGRAYGVVGVTLANVIIVFMMGIVLRIQSNKIVEKNDTGIWAK